MTKPPPSSGMPRISSTVPFGRVRSKTCAFPSCASRSRRVGSDPAEARRWRDKLRQQVGDEADDYVLLLDMLTEATGKKAPNVKGVIDGKPFRLSDHAGKVIVLRFGASWCGHCAVMNPRLKALSQKYDPRTFAVVDVDGRLNLDEPGSLRVDGRTLQQIRTDLAALAQCSPERVKVSLAAASVRPSRALKPITKSHFCQLT